MNNSVNVNQHPRILPRALPLHDVNDTEAAIRQTLNEWLTRRRGWLTQQDYESAFAFILEAVWQAADTYDPDRGLKFRTILNYRVRQRIVDWYRTEKHDARRTTPKPEELPLNDLDPDTNVFEESVLGELALA